MAAVIRALAAERRIEQVVVCTGQHRELLDDLLEFFGIRPDYDLRVMQAGQDLAGLTGRILQGMADVLRRVEPDMVLVQGDTTTVFAAALAAFYEKIDVAHVEAGLRSHDRERPYPEEINRRLVTRLAGLHFAPTADARANLLAEGVDERSIVVTGNTVVDALLETVAKVESCEDSSFEAPTDRMLLVTTHRRENFGQPMRSICRAVRRLVEDDATLCVVLPMHPNPAVREVLEAELASRERIELVEPLAYPDFVRLLNRAELVLTDSGGLQEEAACLGRPALVLRRESDRPEAVATGSSLLVGTDEETIYAAAQKVLGDPAVYESMSGAENPYGDGKAAERIVERVCAELRVKFGQD